MSRRSSLLECSEFSQVSQKVHHRLALSAPSNVNSGLMSFPGVTVSELAPGFPMWFVFVPVVIPWHSFQWNRCLSYGPKHGNWPGLSEPFVCQRIQLWIWMGLGCSAMRGTYLIKILECLARYVYQGEANRNEMQSWKGSCHADESLQSNTLRKYGL